MKSKTFVVVEVLHKFAITFQQCLWYENFVKKYIAKLIKKTTDEI